MVSERLTVLAAGGPDVVALSLDGGSALTYATWDARASTVARGLRGRGVGPGGTVALVFDNDRYLDMAVTWAGVLRSGAVVVPLGPGWLPCDLARVVRHCQAEGVVGPQDLLPTRATGWLAATGELEGEGADERSEPARPAAGREPAEMLYLLDVMAPPRSSSPRPADVSVPEWWTDARPQVLVHAFPPGSHAAQQALRAALSRSPMPLVAVPGIDPDRLGAAVAGQRPQILGVLPAVAALMVEDGALSRWDCSSLVRVVLAGPARPPLMGAIRRCLPGADIVSVPVSCRRGPWPVPVSYDPAAPEAAGRPLAPWRLRVVDAAGEPVPSGERGVVQAKHEAFPGAGSAGWSGTDSAGCLDDEGRLHLVGGDRPASPGGDATPAEPGLRPGPLAPTSQSGYVWREQLAPGSGNDPPFARRFLGRLDVPALEASLREVARRHDALRLRVFLSAGEAQAAPAPADLCLAVIDLSGLEPGNRWAEVEREVAEAATRPVDLVEGPLFSPRLLRLAADDHVLVLPLHHSVWDDWSMGVFNREMEAGYGAFASGTAPPPAEPAASFVEHSRRQRQALQEGKAVASRRWWESRLQGAPLACPLPVGEPAGFAGTRMPPSDPLRLALGAALSSEVRALARSRRSSVFMTMLAAFDVVVQQWTGADDILLAAAIANRTHRTLHDVIGCFTRQVPLRIDLAGDPTFGEAMDRARDTVLGALSHLDLPYDAILREMLGPAGSPHGLVPPPLVVLQTLSGASGGPSLLGLRSEALEVAMTGDQPPWIPNDGPGAAGQVRPWGMGLYGGSVLVVSVVEEPHGLDCVASGAFHPPTVRRLFDDYRTVLVNAVAGPERRLSQLGRGRRSGSGPPKPPHGGGAVEMRGFWVEPGRIAAVLGHCPGISESVVVLDEAPQNGPRLVAYVVAAAGGLVPSLAEVRRRLWVELPGYAWPASVVVVPSLPPVRDHRLLGPPPEGRTISAGTGTAEARLLSRLWAEARGVDEVPIDESYWLSFSFLEALARARDAGLAVTLHQVASNRTVEALAVAVAVGQDRVSHSS